MDGPEDVVVSQPAFFFQDGVTKSLNVGFDQLRKLSSELETDSFLRQSAVDSFGGSRDEGLPRPIELEEGAFQHRNGVGAHDHGGRAVAEERCADKVVRAVGAQALVADECAFAGDEQHARAWVVLGQVLGDTDPGRAAVAAQHVEHDAVHVAAQAQQLRNVQVPARQPDLAGGDVHQVRDLRHRPPPFLDRRQGCFQSELRHRFPCLATKGRFMSFDISEVELFIGGEIGSDF